MMETSVAPSEGRRDCEGFFQGFFSGWRCSSMLLGMRSRIKSPLALIVSAQPPRGDMPTGLPTQYK
jgi:hypothetical protein